MVTSNENMREVVEDMTEKVAEVSIEEEEEDDVLDMDLLNIEVTQKTYDLQYAFVGRFLTERFIRVNEMSQVLGANWRPGMGVQLRRSHLRDSYSNSAMKLI